MSITTFTGIRKNESDFCGFILLRCPAQSLRPTPLKGDAVFPESRQRLLTSEWVMLEVADALAGSDIRQNIRNFLNDLRLSPASEVVPCSSRLFTQALDLYHQHRDKEWTLTDSTSFVIMRERGLTEALTGDRHFEQAGFTALLK